MENISPPQGFLAKRSTGLLVVLLCLVLFLGAILYYTKASAEVGISAVTTYNVSSKYAAIKWHTDVPGVSKVYYSTDTSYNLTNSAACDGGVPVVDHCVVLSGLAPLTTYNYKVETAADTGSTVTSAGFTFTTTATEDTVPPSVPTGLVATWSSASQINISWNASTDNVALFGYKIYRDGVFVADTVTNYFYDEDLAADTSYTYTISVVDTSKNESAISAPLAASTLSAQAAGSAPVITNVRTENITSATAEIKWLTDISSTGFVYYGTASGSYKSYSTFNPCSTVKYSTDHCVGLASLAAGTTYFYKVQSVNSAGKSTQSPEYTFKTSGAAPVAAPETGTTPTPKATETPISFTVSVGTAVCYSGHTYAPVSFAVSPSGAGTIVYGKYGQESGTPFSTQTANLPVGSYVWKGLAKTGYTPSTSSGTFSITPLPNCNSTSGRTGPAPEVSASHPTSASAVKPSPTEYTTLQTESVSSPAPRVSGAVPVPVSHTPVPSPYNAVVAAYKLQAAKQISASGSTIEDKLQTVKEIIQKSPPAPQADTVEIGTTTLSRVDAPATVIAAVSKVIDNRNVIDTKIDTDKDGISDYDETHIYGTDPKKLDTDSDGISDGAEILAGTNPLEKNIVPVLYEDPQQVKVALTVSSNVLSVETAAIATSTAVASEKPTTGIHFQGKGPKNGFVTLYFYSTPIIVTVKTDSEGNWNYTIDKELANGDHQVYVAMTGSGGKILAVTTPVPFIKTASAVTLGLPESTGAAPVGFFDSGLLLAFASVLAGFIIISFVVISLILKKKETPDEQHD